MTAIDSSVAIPLSIETHGDHLLVEAWARGRALALTGHSIAETYSVLTRLPDGLRLEPEQAARVVTAGFDAPLLIQPATLRRLPAVLAECGIAGGAVYDALVGLAAAGNNVTLATRDARARSTYEALGATVELVS